MLFSTECSERQSDIRMIRSCGGDMMLMTRVRIFLHDNGRGENGAATRLRASLSLFSLLYTGDCYWLLHRSAVMGGLCFAMSFCRGIVHFMDLDLDFVFGSL